MLAYFMSGDYRCMFILYLRRRRAVHCLMIVIYVLTDSSLWNKITRTPPRLSYFLRPKVYNNLLTPNRSSAKTKSKFFRLLMIGNVNKSTKPY